MAAPGHDGGVVAGKIDDQVSPAEDPPSSSDENDSEKHNEEVDEPGMSGKYERADYYVIYGHAPLGHVS